LQIYISQGSVATQLRCGGMLGTASVQIFHGICQRKFFEKSVNIWQYLWLTFWATLYITDTH